MINAIIPPPGTLPLLDNNSIKDPNLKIEVFASGLNKPTSMAFLKSGDVLVLEKLNGTVRKIVNGSLLPEPILDVSVATVDTRGMLGIAVARNETRGADYVFLYFTEAGIGLGDGKDRCRVFSDCITDGVNQPLGNMLYRFELSNDENTLVNKKLLMNFSALPGATHNGGKMVIGPDNNIYLIIGDADAKATIVTNNKKNNKIDGRAGILALDHDGNPAFKNGIIGDKDPLNRYYAYGIRNGFGLDFDPVTGNLWDTENGPGYGDEINLVEPGFNSGYKKIQGFWERINYTHHGPYLDNIPENKLVDFDGKGKYSHPEFAWSTAAGVTAIKFLDSDKYGKEYQNDLFVATALPNGDIYHFDLNKDRNGLDLSKPLDDKIADTYEELSDVTFASNLGLISDMTIGPDGYLYIISYSNGEIYRLISTK